MRKNYTVNRLSLELSIDRRSLESKLARFRPVERKGLAKLYNLCDALEALSGLRAGFDSTNSFVRAGVFDLSNASNEFVADFVLAINDAQSFSELKARIVASARETLKTFCGGGEPKDEE